MKKWDYEITFADTQYTITPRTDRAKARTSGPLTFTKEEALEFVKDAPQGFLFSNRNFVDSSWQLVPCGWFVRKGDKLIQSGQDSCPPVPMYEPGDVHPSGPKNGKIAVIHEVRTGEAAKNMGFGVVIIVEEHDAAAN